ncbi:MAG: methyl-accepting chemotaxis protein [Firmicutes bacterium]|nr:methyl-accepting chemotaxis protein [Bacillota bacterium]
MRVTTEVAQKLSEAVKEIGVTMKLISDISSSTNLLALNVSIEAARAGDAVDTMVDEMSKLLSRDN